MMINTGVILAAGLGSRLNEITRAVPKELLTVGGTPIIKYTLESMKSAGIEKLIVVFRRFPIFHVFFYIFNDC